MATVNLAGYPTWSRVTTVLVITNVLLAVPLAMFVVAYSFDDGFIQYFPHMQRDSNYHWLWLLITRPMFLCFGLFVAVMVPHFGLLMGLIGSFTGTCLCFLFPCMIHMQLRWHSLRWWHIGFEMFIIAFGFIAGGMGLFFSGRDLIKSFM